MGLVACGGVTDNNRNHKTQCIDQQMKENYRKELQKIKILIAGAGESGKSTFVRQMKIIHNGSLEIRERERALSNLRQNVVEVLMHLIETYTNQQQKLQLPPQLLQVTSETDFVKLAGLLSEAWQQDTFRCYVNDFYTLHHYANAAYLFENAPRFALDTYQPTDHDVLRSRMKTTGVQEIELTMPHTSRPLVLVDVGGQRSERRKWLHCFDVIDAVIFIVAMDEYNVTLAEDGHTNRLTEALGLFSSLSAESSFQRKRFMLFLNKYDIFKSKISRVPLETYLEGLKPGQAKNVEEATRFLEELFRKQFKQDQDYLDVYVTCALDTENCQRVFNSVVQQMGRLGLENAGLV